jgi:hypothetical protein
MEGAPRKSGTYYRCDARKLVPGSPVLATHPKNVYLPEAVVLEALNGWLGHTFARQNRDATVAALVASQGGVTVDDGRAAAKRRLDTAETKQRRLRAAIEAGADPAALVESINSAQEERVAARAELAIAPERGVLDVAEVYAMIGSLGDVTRVLHHAELDELEELYAALHLEMTYHHEERAVDVRIAPTVGDSACVRGGNRTPRLVTHPLFGDITPKTIAARHSRCHAIAPVSSRLIRTHAVSTSVAERGHIPTLGNRVLTIACGCGGFSGSGGPGGNRRSGLLVSSRCRVRPGGGRTSVMAEGREAAQASCRGGDPRRSTRAGPRRLLCRGSSRLSVLR